MLKEPAMIHLELYIQVTILCTYSLVLREPEKTYGFQDVIELKCRCCQMLLSRQVIELAQKLQKRFTINCLM